jgi:hypothetical protein
LVALATLVGRAFVVTETAKLTGTRRLTLFAKVLLALSRLTVVDVTWFRRWVLLKRPEFKADLVRPVVICDLPLKAGGMLDGLSQ